MSKKIKFFFSFWLPPLVWAVLIFLFSSIPDLGRNWLPVFLGLIVRKFLHVAEFGILTVLLFRALYASSLKKRRSILIAILISFIYALTDEFHQGFVAGRVSAVSDVILDLLGSILAGFLINIFYSSKNIIKI